MQGSFSSVKNWLAEEFVKDTVQKDGDMILELKDVHLVIFIYNLMGLNVLVAEPSFVKKEKANYLKNKKRD